MTENVDATLAAYAEWMRAWNASANTISARVSILRPRLEEWGGVPGVTTAHIQEWLAGLPDAKPWTHVTYYSHAKSLCDWLVASGRLPEHPMTGQVRAPRRPRGLPRPLTEAEAARALDAATGDVRTWLLLAMCAGLRAHEIAKIRGEDVNAEHIYVRGKGRVEALIPTHPELLSLARHYPRRGYWFPDPDSPEGHVPRGRISSAVGRLFRRCDIPHGSIHRARHLYGTRLLRTGANIRQVQRLMRHANVETTAGYTAVDDDELRAAINRLSA